MNFKNFISKCKDKWGYIKLYLIVFGTLYDSYADRLNIFLAKHNIIKVITDYEVEYLGCPVASILVYDKLYKHYDEIARRVDVYGELSNISDNIRMHNIKLRSKHSYIRTIFKPTIR